jgi:superfamily II DNA or RNA helicase
MGQLRNTLLDNSPPLQMADILKDLFCDSSYTTALFATGYLDIPGLALVYDELAAFLERPETALRLLIGQEPLVRSYQTAEPVTVPVDFPRDYIRRDLASLNVQPKYEHVVKLLFAYLNDNNGKFQIRLYGQTDRKSPQFLHAKCYIFQGPGDSVGILGSSNFTQKGLEGNAELNYLETNSPIVTAVPGEGNSTKGHIYWFREKWEESEDWNREFFEEVRRSPIGRKSVLEQMHGETTPRVLSPYEAYITFLIDQFGSQIDTDWKTGKVDFLPKDAAFKKLEYQIQAVNQAFPILNKHNGLFLADVVGLGKTFVGIMIIKRYLMENGTGRPALIITPPAIKQNWISSIAYFDKDSTFKTAPHIRIITIGGIDRMMRGIEMEHGEAPEILGSGDFEALEESAGFVQNNFALILVDESHRFRNRDTNMYRRLQNLIAHTSPQAKVVLLSATPQNNRPEDIRNQIGLFQTELRNTTLDTLGEQYGRNLERYFAEKQFDYDRLIKRYDANGNPKTKTQIDADRVELRLLFKDIRMRIIEPLCIRRTRRDIERYFKDDMENQGLTFPVIREPEKLDYKMNSGLARLFYDTVGIIAPSISKTPADPDDNLVFNMTDQTKVLGYYRYRAIEYLADPKDKAFYEKRNLNVKGISDRLALIMEIHLVKRLESSFAAFKGSLRNLKRYCENMITMLEDDSVFICPDLDINAELSPERQELRGGLKACYQEIERKMQRKDERNRKFAASAFISEYRELLERDKAIIENLIGRWDMQPADPKLTAFLRKMDTVFFNPKINNPQNPDDKKLIIFTEAIPTVSMLADHLDASEYEGKVLAISSDTIADKREIIAANFDANIEESAKRNDYQILITTDVLAEGVNLHRSNMIVNYDSPWNSTRLMQRLGRINRIGSEADFINVYNFYPSAQGDAEINIVERAWNKIQAFHELFGEDSKIFSKEEELVIHDLIQHDEDEGSGPLKYIDVIKRFRSKNPRRFAELENLIGKAVSAKSTGTGTTAAQVKNSRGTWYYACIKRDNAYHPYAISQQEMIERLECPETEMAAEVDTVELDAALAAILDQYATDRQNETITIKTGLSPRKRQKAMTVLHDYAHSEGLPPEASASLQDILHSVRNGNSVLIDIIANTKPHTQAVFVESDIQNWMRYVHTSKYKEEEGTITLAIQNKKGSVYGL